MPTSQTAVKNFLAQKTLAVVGLSRSGDAFSNMVYKDLKSKGYRLFAVNPNAESIQGEKCYPNLSALPEKVGGVLLFTQPAVTEQVVKDAAAAGIRNIWIQQGAESAGALQFCEQNQLAAVSGHCIMMFAEPVAFLHRPHRWILGLLGKLPR